MRRVKFTGGDEAEEASSADSAKHQTLAAVNAKPTDDLLILRRELTALQDIQREEDDAADAKEKAERRSKKRSAIVQRIVEHHRLLAVWMKRRTNDAGTQLSRQLQEQAETLIEHVEITGANFGVSLPSPISDASDVFFAADLAEPVGTSPHKDRVPSVMAAGIKFRERTASNMDHDKTLPAHAVKEADRLVTHLADLKLQNMVADSAAASRHREAITRTSIFVSDIDPKRSVISGAAAPKPEWRPVQPHRTAVQRAPPPVDPVKLQRLVDAFDAAEETQRRRVALTYAGQVSNDDVIRDGFVTGKNAEENCRLAATKLASSAPAAPLGEKIEVLPLMLRDALDSKEEIEARRRLARDIDRERCQSQLAREAEHLRFLKRKLTMLEAEEAAAAQKMKFRDLDSSTLMSCISPPGAALHLSTASTGTPQYSHAMAPPVAALSQDLHDCATSIQRVFRGHKARSETLLERRLHFEEKLRLAAQRLLDDVSSAPAATVSAGKPRTTAVDCGAQLCCELESAPLAVVGEGASATEMVDGLSDARRDARRRRRCATSIQALVRGYLQRVAAPRTRNEREPTLPAAQEKHVAAQVLRKFAYFVAAMRRRALRARLRDKWGHKVAGSGSPAVPVQPIGPAAAFAIESAWLAFVARRSFVAQRTENARRRLAINHREAAECIQRCFRGFRSRKIATERCRALQQWKAAEWKASELAFAQDRSSLGL